MDLKRCPRHQTPLNSTKISSCCEACCTYSYDKHGYKCDFCDFYVHEECINTNIPSRHKHPLKFTSYGIFPCPSCCLCDRYTLDIVTLLYQCAQCDFHICISCARYPLIFNEAKAHNHKLQQVPLKLSFTCDACGLCTSDYPCICHQCCFIVHRKCIKLPRVININRHDHRISYVHSLDPGKWTCGVCREPVNADCGGYSCLICSYVVHSGCATRFDCWNNRDLEGIPEKKEEKGKPFQLIDQNLIKHFSHQHNLKVSVGREEDKHCYACTLPFNSEMCYRCTQCDFILHDACANLPLKKRQPISAGKLTLYAKVQHDKNYFVCEACQRYCNGFSYVRRIYTIDVKCASITDAFKHESHPHWLFPSTYDRGSRTCTVCRMSNWIKLRCFNQNDCRGFSLCFRCATLPTLVRHKYDDHPLSLCYGEKCGISAYWCGICEEEISLKNWFYSCRDCDSTLHTECVFKNLLHLRSTYTLLIRDEGAFDLLPNDTVSRPTCYLCKTHCMGDLVLTNKADTNIFMCTSCGFPDTRIMF